MGVYILPRNDEISKEIRKLLYIAVENGLYQFYERFDIHLVRLNSYRVSLLGQDSDTNNSLNYFYQYAFVYLLCNLFAIFVFLIEFIIGKYQFFKRSKQISSRSEI